MFLKEERRSRAVGIALERHRPALQMRQDDRGDLEVVADRSCWVAGNNQPYAEAVREVLKAPAGMKLFSAVTVGYALEVPNPEKRALKSVLHWERF